MSDETKHYRSWREQTLQLLCQFDAGNEDVAHITKTPFDENESHSTEPDEESLQLAKEVWEDRLVGDAQTEALTPEWPMHRQPLIDRNILRLARYEMTSGMTPPVAAIDEAIELARLYSTEHSSTFVNGVLDALYHQTSDIQK